MNCHIYIMYLNTIIFSEKENKKHNFNQTLEVHYINSE